MTRDLDAIDSALKCLNRELWIVTSADGPRRGGLVATWVSPASIDRERPVLLAGIAPNHFTCELIEASGVAGLHLLRPDQMPVALAFALGSGRERDKLAGLGLQTGTLKTPLLSDCQACFEGQVFARLATGDRTYFWFDVIAARHSSGDVARERDLFRAATPEQMRQLIGNRDEDVAVQRAWHDAWRQALPESLRPR